MKNTLHDRIGRFIRLALALCVLVMGGLLVRDVIVNAEARRELEREIAEAHYRADTASAALRRCREGLPPVYSRGRVLGVDRSK
jgi:hypothetical protein